MSASATALAAGNRALLSVSGERVTFRGRTVVATVNRKPYDRPIKTPFFNTKGVSVIELLRTAVASVPAVGEEFTESDGLMHRVTEVERPTSYTFLVRAIMHD